MRRKILWLPCPPSEGSASMNRHWRELTLQLRQSRLEEFEVSCPFGEPPIGSKRAPRLVRIWNKYSWFPYRIARQPGFDLAHVLDHSCAHFIRALPASTIKVVTVHDLAPLENPEHLTPAQLQRFRRSVEWLNRADVLLPVSHYTAQMLRGFITGTAQIEVLSMGVNVAGFSPAHSSAAHVPLPQCPKILSIGSCLKRKNLELLPDVLSRLVERLGPVALSRVGEPLPPELRQRLSAILGTGNLVELGMIADEKIVAIYQTADVLLFPSRLEGFGLPVAEAMAAGCPVVCSRASSLPEVGADAALYFDPSDAGEAAARVIEVLQNSELRAGMIERGHRRARELSWENHAARLAGIYASVLNGRST